MQVKQVFYGDTLTGRIHITKPKIANVQYENERGIVGASRNLRKVTIFAPADYLKNYETLYSLSINELGYIYSLSKYIGKDNILFINNMALNSKNYSEEIGAHRKNIDRVFKNLIEKKVLKRIKKNDNKVLMFNPIFGCSRNCISYTSYYVFEEELNNFFEETNQGFRLENIKEHFSSHKKQIEREIEIL